MKDRTTADGLRALADFLDANPELAKKYSSHEHLFYVGCEKDPKAFLAEIARRHAPLEKDFSTDYAGLRKQFGGGVSIRWYSDRKDVCVKVVTGTKTVVLPAKEAEPERTVTVEETEWICTEPLLADRPPKLTLDDLKKLQESDECARVQAEAADYRMPYSPKEGSEDWQHGCAPVVPESDMRMTLAKEYADTCDMGPDLDHLDEEPVKVRIATEDPPKCPGCGQSLKINLTGLPNDCETCRPF
jgi:hypothetical protein